MIVETLDETLGGGFRGLYGEVVLEDTYRIRRLGFQPDLVIDVGANVGVFTRFARELFPKAKIVSVEPNPENCIHFRKFTNLLNVVLMEYALGSGGILYHGTTACNGSGETYLSAGLGYPADAMEAAVSTKQGIEWSRVPSLTLAEIVEPHWERATRRILKVDCEGAENCIWGDRASMEVLRQADYVAMEVHDYALTGAEHPKVIAATLKALASLEKTHHCERDGVHFWATKK